MEPNLIEWLRAEKQSQAWLGRKLGVSRSTAHRLCAGTGQVDDDLIARIVQLSAGAVDPLSFLPRAAACWREFHADHPAAPGEPAPEASALTNGGDL